MKRASYKFGVRWIADNDAPADELPIDDLAGTLTVLLLADLFDVAPLKVAADVVKSREAAQ